MKIKSEHIFPFVFALVLPLFGLVSEYGQEFSFSKEIIFKWFRGGIIMLGLWTLLWNIEIKKSGLLNMVFSVALGILYFSILALLAYEVNRPISTDRIASFGFILVMILLIQNTIRSQSRFSKLQVEKEQLEKENYRVQLQNLNNQVNPHFIFNSLNTLRSMIRQGHTNSEQFVVSLSEFYGQSLRSKDEPLLPLKGEMVVMESYLFVMESRNENAISKRIEVDTKLLSFRLPRLSLQLVVENCFKHNRSSVQEPLKIEVRSINGNYIRVRNNKQPKIGEINKSGYGLDMIRKRYDLLNIPDGLVIQEDEELFSVNLKLICT